MNATQMHLEHAGAQEVACQTCGGLFKRKRHWQRFCRPECRNDYHAKMDPATMRRELDELKAEVRSLKARVSALDEPLG